MRKPKPEDLLVLLDIFGLRVIAGKMSGRAENPCDLFCCALRKSMAFLFYRKMHSMKQKTLESVFFISEKEGE